MPISINNAPPSIELDLGSIRGCTSLQVLFDSCAALNSGNLQFHLWLVQEHPHLVIELIMIDDEN